MDINLLDDTKRDEVRAKPAPPPPPRPELTDPARLPKAEGEPRLPSKFSSWIRSLRGKPSEPAPEDKSTTPPNPPSIPDVTGALPKPPPAPEDIFAQLDQPKAKVEATPGLAAPVDAARPVAPSFPKTSPKPPAPPPPIPPEPPPTKPVPGAKGLKRKPAPPSQDRSSLVNLIPAEFRQSINPRSKLLSLGATVLASALVLGMTFGLLTLYRTSILEKIEKLRNDRAKVEQDISDLRPRQRETIGTQTRLSLIASLLDEHVYWTKFFEKLEQYTIDDVYYSGAFAGSLGGQITLTAVGSSFTSPARQLLVFEAADDFASSVSITSASATQATTAGLPPGSIPATQVSFSVTLTLVPDIFTYTSDRFPASRRNLGRDPGDLPPSATNPFGLPAGGSGTGSPTNTNGATTSPIPPSSSPANLNQTVNSSL